VTVFYLPKYLSLRALMLVPLLFLALLVCPGSARADNCTASMTDVSFGPVDSIAGTDYYANGTLSVTCTVVLGSLGTAVAPGVNICVNLEGGSGGTIAARSMLNGGSSLPFNLYRDNTYAAASVWGSSAGGGALPVTTSMSGLLGLGTATQTFTIYGKIPASSLTGARLQNGSDTPFTADFAGAGTIQYAFYGLLATPANCKTGTTVPFSFKASATLTNNCFISTSPLAFAGDNKVLSSAVRTSGSLGVRCTAGSAYQIALNGGSVANNAAARKMASATSADRIGYEISNTLDGPLWGDGSGGTGTVTGTGSGTLQTLRLFGRVPAQKTPAPGDYKDTVTATLTF
jgi:spore coat protein U-like protein